MDKPYKAFILMVSLPLKPFMRKDEDIQLAHALSLDLVGYDLCPLRSPHPATFIGKGWVEKVQAEITAHQIDLVIVDPTLTPLQQRNLEKKWKCMVWDRTALILAIFADRARTSAGKLQVQLAQLLYQKSRLVRAWSHLERQRGGFGFLAGPGESQLELDKRMLQAKILSVQKQLKKLRQTRALHRKSRKSFPTVALVGYTNAGKSTLFNQLTKAQVFQADMPFATLDPTARKVILPSGRAIILTDTVGFISELPKLLRLAFQATLEEIHEADLLLHVRDISSLHTEQQKQDVLTILKEMDCHVPMIEVLNKIDLLPANHVPVEGPSIALSAFKKEGLDQLLLAIDSVLENQSRHPNLHGRFPRLTD